VGRKQTHIPEAYWREQPRWYRNYHTEWSGVVGDRIRRLRRGRDLTLQNLADKVERPDGGRYSISYYSRLERGSSSPPLYVYLAIAECFDLHPGRLLGPDDAERDATAEEMVLIRFLRRTRVSPDDALARLACGESAPDEPAADSLDRDRQDDSDLSAAPPHPPRQEIVKSRTELRRLDFGF